MDGHHLEPSHLAVVRGRNLRMDARLPTIICVVRMAARAGRTAVRSWDAGGLCNSVRLTGHHPLSAAHRHRHGRGSAARLSFVGRRLDHQQRPSCSRRPSWPTVASQRVRSPSSYTWSRERERAPSMSSLETVPARVKLSPLGTELSERPATRPSSRTSCSTKPSSCPCSVGPPASGWKKVPRHTPHIRPVTASVGGTALRRGILAEAAPSAAGVRATAFRTTRTATGAAASCSSRGLRPRGSGAASVRPSVPSRGGAGRGGAAGAGR